MITTLLLILVAIALTGLMVGTAKDDYKWKAVADVSNTLIMLILLVVNIIQGNVVWVIICGVFAILDMLALTYDLTKCSQDTGKVDDRKYYSQDFKIKLRDYIIRRENYKESRNTLDDTKSVLKEFIKEIEEYGSTRH